ncbi:SusC/RagA family TonB-linked outer membrane protein [Bacteroides sp. 519]|uniref:SusC/RagA family TonB-linked outer membrane protein n=1 Tax=Bacteroides sp. 519 TaxID=2302937 RepID=UPI0013D3C7A0|nr:SusC/RagA family TonB-linked outer membrane protein [Bacteroides sp. 519]NDV59691.1 SusC/RagA family TonB-linked outer membrane protein [Bacteroides sp. 519]
MKKISLQVPLACKINQKVIIFVLFICTTLIGNAQNQRITFSENKTTIQKTFQEIEKQTGLSVDYNHSRLDTSKKINLNQTNLSLTEVLNEVLKNTGFTYTIERGHVIIKEGVSQTPANVSTLYLSGVVLDEKGEPIIGANIRGKDATTGTITDIDGKFSVETTIGAVLTVSYIGYDSQDLAVTQGTNNIKITLKENQQLLDEVVVIGYGVARKTDLTGSITQVKAEDLSNYTHANVTDLLRTSIPGMSIGYNSTAKGNSDMLIRGENTLTAGSGPLIVVDGVIYNGDLSDINPNDIEKMDIMKDASSAAVYGSRATNGIVAITTKKGKSDKPIINFNGTFGISTAANRVKPYDKDGFIRWRSDMFKSAHSATVAQEPWSPFDDPRTIDSQYLNEWMAYHSTNEENMIDAWLSGLRLTGLEIENYKAGNYIDWEDHIYKTGIRQDYNLSLSGKKNDITYYWSLGYMDNTALTIGDEFSTIRSRVNIEGEPAKFLKVGLNAQFSYRDESSVSTDNSQYRALTPYSSYYEEDGITLRQYPNEDNQASHPVLTRKFRTQEKEFFTLFPKLYATVKLPFGITYTMNYTTRFVFYHDDIHDSSGHPSWGLFGGKASRENKLNREWQIDHIINWNKTLFDYHKFDITLLANAEKYRGDGSKMTNQGFYPNDNLGYHDMSIGTLPELSSDDNVRTSDAYMARLNYGFKDRYLLTLSVRRDGSSLFGYSNPHATFPAAALGWVLSEEKFFKNDVVDYLKLRVSWGVNGNRDIANYSALSKLAAEKSINAEQNGESITIPALGINTMENKKLKWEKTEAYNLGVDFRILNGILNGSVEVYNMSTTDVLVNRQLPTVTGYSRVYSNLGEVKNKGLEISLSSTNIKRHNFEWRSNFLFSMNRNKIVSITGEKSEVLDKDGNVIGWKEPDDIDNGWFIGQSKDVIWDYKILGTWKVGQEEEAAKWNQVPGDFILEDVDNDGLMTDKDKQFLGNKRPKFSWTLTNSFTLFKDLEVSFILYSLWGHKAAYDLAKHSDHVEDRKNTWDIPYWTPNNQRDDFARLKSTSAKGVKHSAWFNKSYIRLENVALAYRVPKRFFSKTPIDNLKVTFNIRNAGLWATDWKFGDPEDGTRAQRIYTFGINMTL